MKSAPEPPSPLPEPAERRCAKLTIPRRLRGCDKWTRLHSIRCNQYSAAHDSGHDSTQGRDPHARRQTRPTATRHTVPLTRSTRRRPATGPRAVFGIINTTLLTPYTVRMHGHTDGNGIYALSRVGFSRLRASPAGCWGVGDQGDCRLGDAASLRQHLIGARAAVSFVSGISRSIDMSSLSLTAGEQHIYIIIVSQIVVYL